LHLIISFKIISLFQFYSNSFLSLSFANLSKLLYSSGIGFKAPLLFKFCIAFSAALCSASSFNAAEPFPISIFRPSGRTL
jgi:hypothetical protein